MIDESLMRIIFIPFDLLLILILLGTGLYFAQQTPLDDIVKSYVEVGCTKGGFTNVDIKNLKSDLAKVNYDPAQLDIQVTPDIANDISSTSYLKRGQLISLKVSYKKLGMIDKLFKKIGNKTDIKNNSYRIGMSEKY